MTHDANGGPYVQVAALCQTFIRGAESGQLSLINVLEGMTVVGPDPDEMPPVTIGPQMKLVIGLWAGHTKGRYRLKLRPEAPSGLQGDPIDLPPLRFADTGRAELTRSSRCRHTRSRKRAPIGSTCSFPPEPAKRNAC